MRTTLALVCCFLLAGRTVIAQLSPSTALDDSRVPQVAPPSVQSLELFTTIYPVEDLLDEPSKAPNLQLFAAMAPSQPEMVALMSSGLITKEELVKNSIKKSLEELTKTVEAIFPDRQGVIVPHVPTRSLIIRDTKRQHEMYSDLLSQLRRITDTQVEVTLELYSTESDKSEALQALLPRLGQSLSESDLSSLHEKIQPQFVSSSTVRNGKQVAIPAACLQLTPQISHDHRRVKLEFAVPAIAMEDFSQSERGVMPTSSEFDLAAGSTSLQLLAVGDEQVWVVMKAVIKSTNQQQLLGQESNSMNR